MAEHKLKGISSTKSEIIGEMTSGGVSSTVTYLDHIKEVAKIRVKNKQNIFLIILIIINSIFKNIPRIVKDFKRSFN